MALEAGNTLRLQQNKEAKPETGIVRCSQAVGLPKAHPQVEMHEGRPSLPYAGYNGSLIPPSPHNAPTWAIATSSA